MANIGSLALLLLGAPLLDMAEGKLQFKAPELMWKGTEFCGQFEYHQFVCFKCYAYFGLSFFDLPGKCRCHLPSGWSIRREPFQTSSKPVEATMALSTFYIEQARLDGFD